MCILIRSPVMDERGASSSSLLSLDDAESNADGLREGAPSFDADLDLRRCFLSFFFFDLCFRSPVSRLRSFLLCLRDLDRRRSDPLDDEDESESESEEADESLLGE